MKKIKDLELGYADAENYKRRENKELLNKIFIRDQQLDKLCDDRISFLIGEKGTGKTAYSVFLSNNNYKIHLLQFDTFAKPNTPNLSSSSNRSNSVFRTTQAYGNVFFSSSCRNR